MAYTNAVFYIDDGLVSGVAGSDAARTVLTSVVCSQSGTGVLATKTAHGLTTGAVVAVTLMGAAYANDNWKITRVDANSFTFDGALWASWNNADVTGSVSPFGGSSWTDAWATITGGATAAHIAPGDEIRVAKSPDPVSMGNATWTDGPIGSTVAITSSTNATPIVVTATGHGLVNGDFVQIDSHTTNTSANGIWKVANKTSTTFELEGSVGNGVGGATGTLRQVNCRVVYFDTAPTAIVDECEVVWTGSTGLIVTLNGTPTAGGTGYTVNDVLTITTGGTGAQATVTTVSAGAVTAVTLLKGGNGGYTTGSGKATTGGTGSGCTLNITTVGSASVTRNNISPRSGGGCITFTPVGAGGGRKGSLVAYRAISPGSLAAYTQLSFWFQTVPGSLGYSAGMFRICLCSDSAGITVVDEFKIPTVAANNAYWLPITVARTGGGSLGASIASIALYTDTVDPASSQSIALDNIVACGSNMAHASLISKNSAADGGTESWYAVQSLRGRIAVIDGASQDTPALATLRGYSGTTENVATYARETIKTTMIASTGGASDPVNTINDGGTLAGGNISFKGGYNPSGGAQDGHTFYDGRQGRGSCFSLTAQGHVSIERFSAFRYNIGVNATGAGANFCTLSFGNLCHNTTTGITLGAAACLNNITVGCANNNLTSGVAISGGSCDITVGQANNNGTAGITCSAPSSRITCTSAANNATQGALIQSGGDTAIKSMSARLNATAQVQIGSSANAAFLRDCTLSATNGGPVVAFTSTSALLANARIWSRNHNASGYDWGFSDDGTINSEATDRSGGTGAMWRLSITGTSRTSGYPLDLMLAQIAVKANKLCTFKCWVKKTHATNIVGKLFIKGGLLSGVTSDVVATKADDTSYEQLTVTCTPTEQGVLELWGRAQYVASTTDSVLFEDLELSQAD